MGFKYARPELSSGGFHMALESITGRLVYKDRIDNVKSAVTGTFKNDSALAAVIQLGQGFGRNNRKLVGLR